MVIDELSIGLCGWIIQDGNYPDFDVGREYRFALEFYIHEVSPARSVVRKLVEVEPAVYAFAGQVAFQEPLLTILDVGVLCYDEIARSPPFRKGEAVSGRMYLGVDPFPWFETHSKRPDLPNLTYAWRVEEIRLDTTPLVETAPGSKMMVRASQPRTFVNLSKTNAWKDDGGGADYVMRCRLLGLVP